ncbi:hypothetical protein GYMLUDRAFT_578936 [Collybiopsis luxurians FD-317 M1]|uniref:F-box domain-containing protein n=1 Tax=Collybiopsis luxurians FD-317 M1 TaxID=944289 RepID=A0A0D0CZ76_9AGAR|nr:hypothetical protein GYMLUDRAFT_578936 [Collybiopsis luxurians FD-317 M1]
MQSPLDSLPSELLAKIFLTGTELDNALTPLARPSLITYCSVSSRWRTICHHTPELWTAIRVPFAQSSYQDVVAWTITWLESIMLQLVLVLIALIPHASRLKRFYLTVDQTYEHVQDVFRPLRLLQIEAPQLRDFQLRFREDRGTIASMNYIFPITFVSAPLLRRQSLRGVPVQFPLQRLTVLELDHVLPDEQSFRDLAAQSPALEELTMTEILPMLRPADLNAHPKIYFPALRSLKVSFVRMAYAPGTSVLALMSPPNLTHFQIRGIYLPEASTSLPDPAHLTNLHTLRLHEIAVQHPPRPGISLNSASFFLSLPSVKHLQLIETSPQPLFPEPEATRKPLLRSRSGELRSRFNDPSSSSFLSRPKEIDLQILTREPGPAVKLPSEKSSTSSSAPSLYTHWPNLTTITLHTIRAKDLLWLCELVASRPEIETVYLSHSARRYQVEKGNMEPVQWLEQHVKVLDFNERNEQRS